VRGEEGEEISEDNDGTDEERKGESSKFVAQMGLGSRSNSSRATQI
jgi:hypothetical protein